MCLGGNLSRQGEIMTGEKNRFKTHEQLWKLEDGELSTPKHDELVIQLLYKENAKKLLSICFNTDPEYLDTSLIDIESEVPICSQNDFIIGYIDIAILYHIPDRPSRVLFVEVKPKIKSFGETLRQINTYKKYKAFNYVIYSPDITFREVFKTQKINIITPSDLGLK
jgi:hypothetical protein